jgi:hypothetical protein
MKDEGGRMDNRPARVNPGEKPMQLAVVLFILQSCAFIL